MPRVARDVSESEVEALMASRRAEEERDRRLKIEQKCRYGDSDACSALASLYKFSCSEGVRQQQQQQQQQQAQPQSSTSGTSNNATSGTNNRASTSDIEGGPTTRLRGGGADESGRSALDRESLTSCARLAEMFLRGVGVPQSTERAVELLHYSCDNRHMQSCFTLGIMKNFGFPKKEQVSPEADLESIGRVEVDKGAASDYLTMACWLGHGTACGLLADHYRAMDPPTAASRRETARLYHRACEMNHVSSCSNFGLMCLYGVGMGKPHLDLAEKYLNRACDKGQEHACEGLKTLVKMQQEVQAKRQS